MEKLTLIQNELNVKKSKYNSFSDFYYRTAEDIANAVKPLLKKHECNLYISDTMVQIGDYNYACATAIFKDGTDEIGVQGWARESLLKKGFDDPQLTGTASSYARKNALQGLFLLDDGADSDSNNNIGKIKLNESQFEIAIKKIKAGSTKIEDVIERCELTKEQEEKLKQL